MNKSIFKAMAKLNKSLLPTYSKNHNFDLSKASKLQMAIIGYKIWVTKNALD